VFIHCSVKRFERTGRFWTAAWHNKAETILLFFATGDIDALKKAFAFLW
jgi:hypothetical protein